MGWVIDIIGAALFAAGLAQGVSALADGAAIGWLSPLLLLAGGLVRAAGLMLAHVQAIRSAQRIVAARMGLHFGTRRAVGGLFGAAGAGTLTLPV